MLGRDGGHGGHRSERAGGHGSGRATRRTNLEWIGYTVRDPQEHAQKEAEIARKNEAKVRNKWLQIFRIAKTESLRHDLELMIQGHKRDVDRKDAILQMLDRDIDECEEQLQIALRHHFRHVDHLIDVHDERLVALEREFHREKEILEAEFDSERADLGIQHKEEVAWIRHIMRVAEEREDARRKEDQSEYEQKRELISGDHLERIHHLQSTMDSRLEALSQAFEREHTNYLSSTDERTQDYKELMLRDKQLMMQLETRKAKAKDLTRVLHQWRTKLANSNLEEEARAKELESAVHDMMREYQSLKGKVRHQRVQTHRRTRGMVRVAQEAKVRIAEAAVLAERVLRLAEHTRSMESEPEKVFHAPGEGRHLIGLEDVGPPVAATDGVLAPGPAAGSDSTITWEAGEPASSSEASKAAASSRSGEGSFFPASATPPHESDSSLPTGLAKATDYVSGVHEPAVPSDPVAPWQASTVDPTSGTEVGEAHVLDRFFARYNSTLLETLALTKERDELVAQNAALENLVQQMLDGLSVSHATLSGDNPLLVVNGRSGVKQGPVRAAARTPATVDASHMVITGRVMGR